MNLVAIKTGAAGGAFLDAASGQRNICGGGMLYRLATSPEPIPMLDFPLIATVPVDPPRIDA